MIPPLVAAWCAAQTGVRRALAPLLALAVGVAVPIAIVLALNVAGSGRWVPLTTSGGINLSLGYHAGATGTYDEPWERKAPEFSARHTEPEEAMIAMASAETGRPLSPEEASAYWGRKAVEWIRTHPAAAAALTLRKAALMLNGTEVPNHLDYDFIRDRAPALWLMPLGFGAVLPLAVLGLGDSLRRRRNTRPGGAAPAPRPVLPGARAGSLLLLLASAGAMAGVLPFTVADRYRAPMVPALIVAAGGGVGVLIRLYRHPGDRADRRVLALLTASLLAALVTMIPLQRPLRGRDWWMFAQAYKDRGDLPAAAAAYETAVRVEGGNGELLNNLAVVYRALGERDRAIAALREATRAEPGLAYPHKNLGMLLAARGEYDSALVELRAAGRIDPADAQTQGAIGALLAERGEPVAAAAAFALARRLAPRDRRLMELIRHYDTAPGRGTPPGSLRR